MEIIDFLTVAACYWILSWLLYLTFVRDFCDIILFATQKYRERFKWLCRIIEVNNLFKYSTNEKSKIPEITSSKVDCEEVDEVFENSPAIIHVTRNDDSFQRLSIASPMTPHIAACRLVSPRRINLNSDGNCKKDVAYVSPLQQSYFRQKIFSWGFRPADSFQNENCSESSKFNKLMKVEEKVKERLPLQQEDEEKLIKSDESPKYIGCCGNLLNFLKNKFVISQDAECSMHYKRF